MKILRLSNSNTSFNVGKINFDSNQKIGLNTASLTHQGMKLFLLPILIFFLYVAPVTLQRED